MSAEVKKEIQLEIAHVLFIDIVGYSKLSINDQRAAIDELTQAVRTSEQFQNAEAAARLLKIPTGDGMALVFYKSPEEPVECALEISRALKDHPKIRLRMGVHSGPVSGVIDVNGQANLAGAGVAGFVAVSRRAARSSSAVPEKSIAVLPFENRSQDKDDSYFADGIQDEILTRLSKIADLKVISRTSTQHYKSAPENLPEIARQLGVAHILEGSVQKSGDAVRVNVQLIKAVNDSH